MTPNRYTCQGCDQPILFGVYCQKCDEEVSSLLEARQFVWPRWAKYIGYGLLWTAAIALFYFCLYQAIVDYFQQVYP